MKRLTAAAAMILAMATTGAAVPAAAQALGPDALACGAGAGPAILATVSGLKDRTGEVRVELYPATAEDFLKPENELAQQAKLFRRVAAVPPPSGTVAVCIRVPRPGRYALLVTHNRDGRRKFDYKVDGAGVSSNKRIGFGKPKVDSAMVSAGPGVTPVAIRLQYLGLFGFSPSSAN